MRQDVLVRVCDVCVCACRRTVITAGALPLICEPLRKKGEPATRKCQAVWSNSDRLPRHTSRDGGRTRRPRVFTSRHENYVISAQVDAT